MPRRQKLSWRLSTGDRIFATGSDSVSNIVLRSCGCFSGVEKLTRSSLKGFLNRALVTYKNGRFASSFLLLGVGLL